MTRPNAHFDDKAIVPEEDRKGRPKGNANEAGPSPFHADPTKMPKGGHNDPGFDKNMSAFWGILWYLQKMNQDDPTPNGPKAAWNCQDCSWDHLIDGAVRYNGGGNPKYRQEIEEALALSGCKK